MTPREVLCAVLITIMSIMNLTHGDHELVRAMQYDHRQLHPYHGSSRRQRLLVDSGNDDYRAGYLTNENRYIPLSNPITNQEPVILTHYGPVAYNPVPIPAHQFQIDGRERYPVYSSGNSGGNGGYYKAEVIAVDPKNGNPLLDHNTRDVTVWNNQRQKDQNNGLDNGNSNVFTVPVYSTFRVQQPTYPFVVPDDNKRNIPTENVIKNKNKHKKPTYKRFHQNKRNNKDQLTLSGGVYDGKPVSRIISNTKGKPVTGDGDNSNLQVSLDPRIVEKSAVQIRPPGENNKWTTESPPFKQETRVTAAASSTEGVPRGFTFKSRQFIDGYTNEGAAYSKDFKSAGDDGKIPLIINPPVLLQGTNNGRPAVYKRRHTNDAIWY